MTKTNALRLLESAAVNFTAREYPVDDGKIDALAIAAKLGVMPERVFKTLVTEAPGHLHFVFVIPAPCTLDLKKAAQTAGVKSIEMIPQKQLLPLTGYIHGGCSPVGLKKPFPIFIDETAQLHDTIFVSGGRVGLNVELTPEALTAMVQAEFADLTQR